MRSFFAETRSLFDCLSEVAFTLTAARQIHLFLDFDGTLAPIEDDPAAVSISAENAERLGSLAGGTRFFVSIISGRSLADLQRRVGLEGLTYSGNHGLEIRGPRLRFIQPDAQERMPALHALATSLQTSLRHVPGVLLEDKGLTASVHYRKVPEPDRGEVRRIVKEWVAPVAHLFGITPGHDVFEIRPRVNWTKGTAAKLILASSASPGALPVYVGDDLTDEDAFCALAGGITVRVGRTGVTQAQYWLEYQEAVWEFLAWLGEMNDGPARADEERRKQ